MLPLWLAAIGGELVKNWTQGQQQKRDLSKTETEFKQERLKSSDSYKQQWEVNALLNSGVWMRRFTLGMFSYPLVWGYFDPVGVTAYFQTLETMPEWYLAAYGGIIGAIWGLSELRTWRAGK